MTLILFNSFIFFLANAKKKINELNKIKKVETKGKRLIKSQKILLSLSYCLETIFNNNNNYNSTGRVIRT